MLFITKIVWVYALHTNNISSTNCIMEINISLPPTLIPSLVQKRPITSVILGLLHRSPNRCSSVRCNKCLIYYIGVRTRCNICKWWQQQREAVATAGNGGSSGSSSRNHQRRRTLDDAAVRWKEGSVRASDRRKGKGRDALTKPPANAPPRNC